MNYRSDQTPLTRMDYKKLMYYIVTIYLIPFNTLQVFIGVCIVSSIHDCYVDNQLYVISNMSRIYDINDELFDHDWASPHVFGHTGLPNI